MQEFSVQSRAEYEVRQALATYKIALVSCHYRNWWHRFVLSGRAAHAMAAEQAFVTAEDDGIVPGAPEYKNDAAVEIKAGFQLETSEGQTIVATNSNLASGATALIELLGQTITSVSRCPNNEFSFVFSDKAVLRLAVDEEGFKPYHLHVNAQSVEVTKDW